MPRIEEDEDEGKEQELIEEDNSNIDPLVNSFAEFGTTGDLSTAIATFIEDNCEVFEGADADGEQNLAWTDMHNQFVEMIELHLETFCKEHDTTAEKMFELLAEVNNSEEINQEFVPQVIKLCEYPFFFQNMKEAADIRVNKRKAMDMAESAEDDGSFNISGCYELATELLDAKAINAYYTFTGCPWYFRKILVAAQKRLEDIVIQHEDNTQLIFKYTLQFFGRTSKIYTLDNVQRESENMWGAKVSTCCTQSSSKVRIKVDGPRYARRGYNLNTFGYEDVEGETMVCWRRCIYEDKEDEEPMKDEEGNVIGTTIYFRPASSGGRK
mmetsp:Transcript_21822/g.43576  ORF Transcript_21822/g.43576 Transcript_21822/m.43576 type:complete len:326 (+) Transcript_21822:135-1112(+)|eukprot:CAMPEP_0182457938 /NCGR_PEP_ID=MMETSP1319-20130603/3390_1 /TAXON_ID=172717 /ORGANISM="Bolidomonas pacifica, Strain RCC208" /LENGTH=325 /DNA_ID=CAMNT_0024656509 /DNA_START=311 /DNA_END=1288 /DNA_ORIENTATION=-